MKLFIDPDVAARVERLELGFNATGTDRYGISRSHLTTLLSPLAWFYRSYFRVVSHGVEHIPTRGRAMIVCNHSGGYAIDAAMILASCLLELDPPRLAQGMVEKFLARLPFANVLLPRIGQLTGLPEHAVRFLLDDRLLMVFPEGARGTAKLYWERYSLVRFGTGFMRLALQTNTPVIPTAFIGGGEVVPSIMNLNRLGKALGAPYIPITPYLLPLPLPAQCHIHYGAPMHFEGNGSEDDETIGVMVEQVRRRIARLIHEGRRLREPDALRGHASAGDA